MRDAAARKDPRPAFPLEGCTVEEITRAEAYPLIMRYEWLKSIPTNSQAYYGLRAPTGELLGVSIFGPTPGTASLDVCGKENAKLAIGLVRGACTHVAHAHAGSHLTATACRMAAAKYGWRIFVAYQDTRAGEVGTIYQACNWHFIGATGRGTGGYRTRYKAPDGKWWTSRRFRALKKREGNEWPHYEKKGWKKGKEPDKGKYVHFEGGRLEKKRLRKQLRYPVLEYPKRKA
jgi:hypothetical protein